MSGKNIDHQSLITRISIESFGTERKRASDSDKVVAPANSPGEPSRPDLYRSFSEKVSKLEPAAQVRLMAYIDGSPYERAMEAILYDDLEALSDLLDAGAEVDAHTVQFALDRGNLEAVSLLKSRGVDLQGPGRHHARTAVGERQYRYLKQLLELGVKPTRDMLNDAILLNHRKCAKVLLKHGLLPNELLSECNTIPTSYFTPYIKLLVENGADLNTLSVDGKSLLHRACEEGNLECVTELVACGCNVNQRSLSGDSPIHWVCFSSDRAPFEQETAIIRLLCEHGADPAAKIMSRRQPVEVLLKVPPALMVCWLACGMVRDWSRYGRSQVEEPAEVVRAQMASAIEEKNRTAANDCVRALSYLLTSDIKEVRDKCADLLAEVMFELDWFPEETCELTHEALRMYLDKLDHDPPRWVQYYAAKYNFSDTLVDARAELWAAGLRLDSKESKTFAVKGYDIRRHALLLCEYALKWGLNPAVELVHMGAILQFVDGTRSALDLNDPADRALDQKIRDSIRDVRQQVTDFRGSP